MEHTIKFPGMVYNIVKSPKICRIFIQRGYIFFTGKTNAIECGSKFDVFLSKSKSSKLEFYSRRLHLPWNCKAKVLNFYWHRRYYLHKELTSIRTVFTVTDFFLRKILLESHSEFYTRDVFRNSRSSKFQCIQN